jgi:hypothetical protein
MVLLVGTVCADVHVTRAWSRETPPGTPVGAAYFSLRNETSVTIVLVGADTAVAERAEFHETMMHDGLMTMHHHEEFVLEPGAMLEFVPGGNHVMLMGLGARLEHGQVFALSLRFRDGNSIDVAVDVKRVDYLPD